MIAESAINLGQSVLQTSVNSKNTRKLQGEKFECEPQQARKSFIEGRDRDGKAVVKASLLCAVNKMKPA